MVSLYIHYPFCRSKCPYCDFNSWCFTIDEQKLIDAYLTELDFYKQYDFDTIYFGGGTPTLMTEKLLESILNKVNCKGEISMEANPNSISYEKLKNFKTIGVNRLSIGIQSLKDDDLKMLGRIHNREEGIQAIKNAEKIFKDKYSIDLIYSRPNQNITDWSRELEQGIALSPYHISAYQLIIERGTTNSMGVKNIDTLIAYQDEEKLINTINDDAVLEIFKRYDINEGNNFVVLHQRNLHSPYRANYIHREQEFNKFSNEYDNCMLYEDSLLNDLITELKKTNKTFYLFITSDHGEMIGQNGKWGHGTLDPLSAEIPMMLYTNDKNKTILNEFKKIWSPTHWDILQIITKIMGYKVDNPNTPDNVYYINNTDLMGRDGFIKVIKDTKNKKIDYEIVR
ncbi:MAG: hypothetical protein Ta2D_04760 [Rickettsiales bacterium]|nr:MAG: hypothetical protein Ta2D_04760 [Rickettsiales bacterium]